MLSHYVIIYMLERIGNKEEPGARLLLVLDLINATGTGSALTYMFVLYGIQVLVIIYYVS